MASAGLRRCQQGLAALAGACFVVPKRVSADGPPLDDKSAANLRPFHLSSWQESNAGLVKERQVNKFLNPIAVSWPLFNFLNPDELVMGHIILNDSKKGSGIREA
ncbi:hypothetical protein AK812_SmicGene41577 [Symbiodinium microadriaticum]|uniref:Uncharacterized protein n=1 Tax=Symbiodinium microadriaticum TaxID=2951 RepID=A0A1Q9C5U0_SYMMI|nr:hypothetical protein AK812_SmicGene41577 [Symbiodinium microadriaticum]